MSALAPDLGWAALAVALAGVVRGFTGFGAAMIMAPALSLLYSPASAIATMTLIEVPAVLQLLPQALRHGDWRTAAPLGAAAVVTVPLGAWVLVAADPDVMRRAIGLLVLAFVAALATGWRYRGAAGLPVVLGIGAGSGFLGGATSMAGPPVILFYLAGPARADAARASIMGFFVFVVAVAIVTYGLHGLYTQSVLVRAGLLAPVYIAAIWLGSRLFAGAHERLYRRIALVVLAGIAAAALLG